VLLANAEFTKQSIGDNAPCRSWTFGTREGAEFFQGAAISKSPSLFFSAGGLESAAP
jgi:hypothetical protein